VRLDGFCFAALHPAANIPLFSEKSRPLSGSLLMPLSDCFGGFVSAFFAGLLAGCERYRGVAKVSQQGSCSDLICDT